MMVAVCCRPNRCFRIPLALRIVGHHFRTLQPVRNRTVQSQNLAIGNLEYETVQQLTVLSGTLNWNRSRVELYGPHGHWLAVAGGVARVGGARHHAKIDRIVAPTSAMDVLGQSRETGRQPLTGLDAWTKLYWVLTQYSQATAKSVLCATTDLILRRRLSRVRHPRPSAPRRNKNTTSDPDLTTRPPDLPTSIMEATANPRITCAYLNSYVGKNVIVVGKVLQLRGEEALIDADGNITAHLNRVSSALPLTHPRLFPPAPSFPSCDLVRNAAG